MPLQATSGAASYDAFGGGVAVVPNFIEDVFSTYLYTGTGASLPIVNGIDLSGKGGLVWSKRRSGAAQNKWYDSARGIQYAIESDTTDANQTEVTGITSFNSDGYTYGTDGNTNSSGSTYVSWTFRKQPKFFDIVTYSGNSVAGREIPHNLGSTPGCIIVKRLDSGDKWPVYHRGISDSFLRLNTTDANAAANAKFYWGNDTIFIAPTSTVFTVATDSSINQTGGTYVAYLFAHDAGGFGLAGTDNVISCGSYTHTSGTDTAVSLGYEPQWLLIKSSSTSGSNWFLVDNMRGLVVDGDDAWLAAQSSNAENTSDIAIPQATGFSFPAARASGDYIYIAIRRGPMKVPTLGTSVFTPSTYTGNDGSNREITGLSFTPDLMLNAIRSANGSGRDHNGFYWFDRLRGKGARLRSSQTLAEYLVGPAYEGVNFLSYSVDAASGESNYNPSLYVSHLFKRAPSFFDEVCYTGTGSATTVTHNLAAVPELIIVKRRDTTGAWDSYCSALANTEYVVVNTTAAKATGATRWNSTTPTSSVFSVGTSTTTNASAGTYVAYLFATCAGVSKVGSYTGNGTTQTINCGFTAGSRFVMIKRTDSTGDWYVWDSARGIVAGNDPYLLVNSIAAEVTGTDYVDTAATGFEISSTAPDEINANGGSFIFFAVS